MNKSVVLEAIPMLTLEECRRAVFNQFCALQKGEISIDEALASSKLMHQIVQFYQTEVQAIQVITEAYRVNAIPLIQNVSFITCK